MTNGRKIASIIAAILFAAITIYRIEMKAVNPDNAQKYFEWEMMNHYLVIVGDIILCLYAIFGHKNRLSNACVGSTLVLNLYMLIKLRFLFIEEHTYTDYTMYGLLIIFSLFYTTFPYIKTKMGSH